MLWHQETFQLWTYWPVWCQGILCRLLRKGYATNELPVRGVGFHFNQRWCMPCHSWFSSMSIFFHGSLAEGRFFEMLQNILLFLNCRSCLSVREWTFDKSTPVCVSYESFPAIQAKNALFIFYVIQKKYRRNVKCEWFHYLWEVYIDVKVLGWDWVRFTPEAIQLHSN